MKILSALLAIAVIWMVFASKSKETIKDFEQIETIVAFGDSLTFGYGAQAHESYPSILARLSGKKVINEGINGETTAEGLRRFSAVLKRHRPDLVLLCEGGNDMLQGIDQAQIKSNLEAMIAEAKRHNIKIVLIAVPRLGIFGLGDHPLYAQVAKGNDVLLIEDVLSEILSEPSLKSDQIHPNAKGYFRFAKRVYEFLSAK